MAIVDEADSVLIDDARVPLILSAQVPAAQASDGVATALDLARNLEAGTDFRLSRKSMSAELTSQGRVRVEHLAIGLAVTWRNALHRDESVCTALAALHLYERDRDYIIQAGAVSIIDPSTGRVAQGRVWSRGLHQSIETKEGCTRTAPTVTVAQITYQRFFRRYLALTGMSGTLREARGELKAVYGLDVVRVPLGRPSRRTILPARLYASRDAQWNAVIDAARQHYRTGRPVLIGTDTVEASEALSQRLAQAGLPHAVLNARQDFEEARIVAQAGRRGQITVATNMAGRGTDIALEDGVAGLGGLHVICCQHGTGRRIDRQLIGRCARHGDPGSAQSLLTVDKVPFARLVKRWLAHASGETGLARPRWLVRLLVLLPQVVEEMRQRAQRRTLLEHDMRAAKAASFGRPLE
jgi:preprotein translocase subunit SecA